MAPSWSPGLGISERHSATLRKDAPVSTCITTKTTQCHNNRSGAWADGSPSEEEDAKTASGRVDSPPP